MKVLFNSLRIVNFKLYVIKNPKIISLPLTLSLTICITHFHDTLSAILMQILTLFFKINKTSFFITKTKLNKGITNKKIKEFQKLEMSCHTFCNLVVNWLIFF